MKNVNIMGVHQFLGEGGGVTNNDIYGEFPKKGGLAKKGEEGVFEGWYLDAHYDLILVHAR